MVGMCPWCGEAAGTAPGGSISTGIADGGLVGSGSGGIGSARGITASPVSACGSIGSGATPRDASDADRWPGTCGAEPTGRVSPGWPCSGGSGVKSSGA
jgi:hypothetical protein